MFGADPKPEGEGGQAESDQETGRAEKAAPGLEHESATAFDCDAECGAQNENRYRLLQGVRRPYPPR